MFENEIEMPDGFKYHLAVCFQQKDVEGIVHLNNVWNDMVRQIRKEQRENAGGN